MREEFIIIRAKSLGTRGGGPTLSPASGGRLPLEDFTVEIDRLEHSAAQRARSLAEVYEIANVLPLKLIRPVETGNPPHDPTAVPTEQWGLRAVGALQSPFSGVGTTVAVLDTGIDQCHPSFDGVELLQKNFTNEGPEDRDGHGTHRAATIFGRDFNHTRIGVARGVQRALIGKVIGKDGGNTAGIFEAILRAVNEGANVLSMSLGIDFPGYQRRLTEAGLPQ